MSTSKMDLHAAFESCAVEAWLCNVQPRVRGGGKDESSRACRGMNSRPYTQVRQTHANRHTQASRPVAHLQKKRRNHVIWRMGRSYLLLTKKSVTPRKPSGASMLMPLSMALWKGGITD